MKEAFETTAYTDKLYKGCGVWLWLFAVIASLLLAGAIYLIVNEFV